jgi:hypothetical protein
MWSRRHFLLIAASGYLTSARAQSLPKLISLSKGVTSPRLTADVHHPPKREINLEGWFVCNGAEASRIAQEELFQAIGEQAGAGDNHSTFNLPNFPVRYRSSGQPIGGVAICPYARLGLVGELAPFDIDQNL